MGHCTIGSCTLISGEASVRFSTAEIARMHSEKLRGAQGAQAMLTGRIIKDTDPFVPMDTGMLAVTPREASDFENGIIVYDRPYARRLYYGETFNFAADRHPKATHHWFEKAKAARQSMSATLRQGFSGLARSRFAPPSSVQ